VACFLGVGVLEVVSERVGVDRTDRAIPGPAVRAEPSLGSVDLERGPAADGEAPVAAAGGLTSVILMGRLTVLEVDETAHRLVALSDVGRVLVADVGRKAVVVTEDGKAAALGIVKAGDVVRVEPGSRSPRRIVVLRRG
jgi:hypothetical protein